MRKPNCPNLARLWRWLTEPAASVHEPDRQQARLLSSRLALIALAAVIFLVLIASAPDARLAITTMICLLLGAVCMLNRAGRHRLTAPLATQQDRQLTDKERVAIELGKERELSEIKRRFMMTAEHEFRTPLAIILASSELLEMYQHKMTPERRADAFAAIRTQVMSLGAMLDDMRTILNVEAGNVGFEPIPLDLARLCRAFVDDVQSALGARHRLEFTSEGDLAAIPVDRMLFERIVKNLLSNAIKFSPQGGAVRVKICRRDNAVILVVSDDGIGIPLKDQPRIFEPYHRAENAVNIPGIGLGLTIVHDFVKLHGGSIEFTSAEGEGTTFRVTLPVRAL